MKIAAWILTTFSFRRQFSYWYTKSDLHSAIYWSDRCMWCSLNTGPLWSEFNWTHEHLGTLFFGLDSQLIKGFHWCRAFSQSQIWKIWIELWWHLCFLLKVHLSNCSLKSTLWNFDFTSCWLLTSSESNHIIALCKPMFLSSRRPVLECDGGWGFVLWANYCSLFLSYFCSADGIAVGRQQKCLIFIAISSAEIFCWIICLRQFFL